MVGAAFVVAAVDDVLAAVLDVVLLGVAFFLSRFDVVVDVDDDEDDEEDEARLVVDDDDDVDDVEWALLPVVAAPVVVAVEDDEAIDDADEDAIGFCAAKIRELRRTF